MYLIRKFYYFSICFEHSARGTGLRVSFRVIPQSILGSSWNDLQKTVKPWQNQPQPMTLCVLQTMTPIVKLASNQQQILPRKHHKIGCGAQTFEPHVPGWGRLVDGILPICHWNLFKMSSINHRNLSRKVSNFHFCWNQLRISSESSGSWAIALL